MGSIVMGGPPKLKTVVIPGQKYPEACVWQPTSNLLVLFKFFVGYSFLSTGRLPPDPQRLPALGQGRRRRHVPRGYRGPAGLPRPDRTPAGRRLLRRLLQYVLRRRGSRNQNRLLRAERRRRLQGHRDRPRGQRVLPPGGLIRPPLVLVLGVDNIACTFRDALTRGTLCQRR